MIEYIVSDSLEDHRIKNKLISYLISQIDKDYSILERKPHIKNVIEFITTKEYKTTNNETSLVSKTSLEKIIDDMNNDFTSFIERPLLWLTKHRLHHNIYNEYNLLNSSSEMLEMIVIPLIKDLSSNIQTIFEIGSGSCGFTLRLCSLLTTLSKDQSFLYMLSDIYYPTPPLLISDKVTFDSIKWNINDEIDHDNTYDLFVACNSIHNSKSLEFTLSQIKKLSKKESYLLLEEGVDSFPLYLWGLDESVWKETIEDRSFRLWNTKDKWIDYFNKRSDTVIERICYNSFTMLMLIKIINS